MLEQACRQLDVAGVQDALARGANADQGAGANDESLVILTLLNRDDGDQQDLLSRKGQIIQALFEAGASKNPHHSPDEGIVAAGIEVLIEGALDRLGYPGWNEDAEISLLETWLEAGNDPNPMVCVDGRIKPLIRSLGFMLDEMKHWAMPGEDAKTAEASGFIYRLVGVLHVYGCPLSDQLLDEAGFEPHDIARMLDRGRAEVQARALAAGTIAAAQAAGKPGPRI